MPDQDIYNRHIPRGWQTAARFTFTSQDDELIAQKLLRALGKAIKRGGCPGIDEIAAAMADFVASPNVVTCEEARKRLERITRSHANERTAIACDTARQMLDGGGSSLPTTTVALDEELIKLTVSKRFLVELAMSRISSPKLAASLSQNGKLSIFEYVQRHQHVEQLLTTSHEIALLAQRLIESPDGAEIKTPRLTISKLTTEEAASYQLSS